MSDVALRPLRASARSRAPRAYVAGGSIMLVGVLVVMRVLRLTGNLP
jgi:hypothetical protein